MTFVYEGRSGDMPSPLRTTRSYLTAGSPFLQPFILIHNGEVVGKVYGDLDTIKLYTTAIDNVRRSPYYYVLDITSPYQHSTQGFLYLWYYLNGLGDQHSLKDVMVYANYVIPMPGVNAPPHYPREEGINASNRLVMALLPGLQYLAG